MDTRQIFAIIVAGGKGLRMGGRVKKQFRNIDQTPVLSRTLMQFDQCDMIESLILVVPAEDEMFCQKQIVEPCRLRKPVYLVPGGKQRQDSVYNGLKKAAQEAVSQNDTLVLIHDGVRPFVPQNLIVSCIKKAKTHGACIPVMAITDTIKRVGQDNHIDTTLDRNNLVTVQTPQAFHLDLLLKAFLHARQTGFSGTDDASLVEHLGNKVAMIPGSKNNIKITTSEDLRLAHYISGIQ